MLQLREETKIIIFAICFGAMLLGFSFLMETRDQERSVKISECVVQNKELHNPRQYCEALIITQKVDSR